MYRNHLIEKFDEAVARMTCGDLLLRHKLSMYGKARYLHQVGPSVYRKHQGGTHSGLSYEQRLTLTIESREIILAYFRQKGWPTELLEKELTFKYLFAFGRLIFRKKAFQWRFLYKALSYARKSQTSLPEIHQRTYNLYKSWNKKNKYIIQ